MKRERLIQIAAGSPADSGEIREMAAELMRILEPLAEVTLPPAHNRTDTSAAAALSMRDHAQHLRHIVYGWFADRGPQGATCDALEADLDLRHQTASARVHELWAAGKLVRTHARARTRSGRLAAVYVSDLNSGARHQKILPNP